jgi:energy-coupling factor transport system permease protein
VLGHTDITLEATVYGGVLALRAIALILCGALYTAAIDPDEVLRLFRRVSFHSALTATLATRMVPVLLRDSRRVADAQRCRPGPAPSRLAVLRAASTGVLDRALDVAAALEVRGYGAARRPPRTRRPYSRHDLAFAGAAVAIAAVSVLDRAAGVARFEAYPALHVSAGVGVLVLAGALPALALLPFLDRRGVQP